jgi:hypothetical protein
MITDPNDTRTTKFVQIENETGISQEAVGGD